MNTLLRIKGAAALLLLASLALPQSTCSGYRGPDGTFVLEAPRDATPGTYQPAIERHYALEDFEIGNPSSWMKLLAFVWPVATVAVVARARGRRLRTSLAIAEPILALCSAYLIWGIGSLFATPAVGMYVAISALAIYLAACVVDLWRAVRSRRAEGQPSAPHVGTVS